MDNERRMIVDKLISEEGRSWIKEKFKTHWKNFEKARKLRIKGNSLYAKKSNDTLQMEEIHKLYSQCISFAECGSEELAFGYGNRSAILLRMKKYKECITDIDSALKISNSEKFNVKLICRKVECMKNLIGLNTESKKLVSEVESLVSIIKNEDTDKKTLKESMEKVKNVCIPCIPPEAVRIQEIPKHVMLFNRKVKENPFDSISIRWDKKYGPYLVANRDFKPGEIVFVEKPYVQVANLKNYHIYCGHCLAICWATIPCDHCSWCMFCSEDCKRISWELYHYIECNVISRIIHKKSGTCPFDQLTIRTLVLGIREAGSIQNLKKEIENIDYCTDNQGLETISLLKNVGFKSVYTLNGKINTKNLPEYASKSVFILISLMKLTSLFDENMESNLENILINNELLFIGSLLLKLYKVSELKHYQLPGENLYECSKDFPFCKSTACCDRGFCLQMISSLINNDCGNSQVANFFCKKSNKIIVCSLRPVKKDSQIFLSYCGNYSDVPKNERQAKIKKLFNLTCTCKACEENWPLVNEELNLIKMKPEEKFHINELKHLLVRYKTNLTFNTIQSLSKAICKAHKDLKHPSQILCKFECSMSSALQTLYENC